jgi:4-diphosphocytidyl-2-C-methyl-D-erythritol kinase
MEKPMRPLTLAAPAKINLVLEVLRRRPDGYHEIRSVMHALALSDTLTIRAGAPGVRLTCDPPGLPTGPDNLVHRAAVLLSGALGRTPAVHIHLRKRVPVAAGLGGGSSDAAATLRGLCRFWRVRLTPRRLADLAAELGSDVPFFLRGGCALASGRGERLHPWPAVPGLWIALVNPGIAVPTSAVYKNLKMPLTSRKNYINLMRPAIVRKNPTKIGLNLFNRLEEVTLGEHPVIGRIKAELLDSGATAALMSGSGSTVFGLLPSRAVGERILKTFGPRYPVVRLTRTVGPWA